MAVPQLSTVVWNRLLDGIWRTGSISIPGACYAALFKTAPSNLATGTGGVEETASWYSRPSVRAAFSAVASAQQIANDAAVVSFGTPDANSGPYVFVGFFDASTGTAFYYGGGPLNFTVGGIAGNVLQFALNTLIIRGTP